MAERDVTTIALIGAAAVAGVGLYLWSKGPPGVNPGDTVYGDFTFDYLGQGGSYILLVRFGWWFWKQQQEFRSGNESTYQWTW